MSSLTYCILIKGHGRRGDIRQVRHAYRKVQNLDVDLATFNAILDAYARNGFLRAAEEMLCEMQQRGVTPSPRSYNTLLKGYARDGKLRPAFNVVRRMRDHLGPTAPNQVTYSTLVHACVGQGEFGRARQILQWMAQEDSQLGPDVWAYTALMRGLLSPTSTRPALAAYDRASARAAPSATAAPAETVGGATMVSRPGALQEAVDLLREMLLLDVQPNEVTTTTLLTACFDSGNVTVARGIASLLRERAEATSDGRLTHAADSAMVVGFCRPGGGQATRDRSYLREALALFVKMTEAAEGDAALQPGARTCNALLAALVASGEITSAARVLAAMDAGVAAAADAYSLCIMMRGYGARRKLREVEGLWQRMLDGGLVDVVVLNTYLKACALSGDVPRALQATNATPFLPLSRA